MVYTAVEIVFFLVVAALLGLVLGWLLRGKSIRERLESQWRRLVDDERNNLRQAHEQLKRAEAETDTLADDTKGLQAKIDRLEPLAGENRKLQQQLEGAQAQLAKLEPVVTEHAQLRAECEGLQTRISELEPVQGENVALSAKLEALQTHVSELEATRRENAELQAEIEAQRARIDALGPLQEQIQGLRNELESAQAELDELPPLRAENRQLRDSVESLSASLAEAKTRTTEGAGATNQPAPEAALEASQGAPSAGDLRARVEHIARRTSGGKPAADDDLKQIRGVGPVIERLLKQMGITSYRQIANFTEEDIDQVTAAMGSFRGRIQRDGWTEGAREQHRNKYGDDA